MRSWIKRLMLLVGLLFLILALVVFRSISLLHGTPEWYRRSTATLAEREAAARRAFNKFVNIQNAAAVIRNNRRSSSANATTGPSTANLASTITVSFTDDELNAFFEKWSNFENWKQNYEGYVEDPIIILRQDRILLAGKMKDLDTIVSVEFDPTLDADGNLNLRLTSILGGRLPVPQALAAPYFHRLIDLMNARLPAWQAAAAIESDGTANRELISASLARLLIHTLRHEPTDPILFLPVIENHANVPVRIVGESVQPHLLSLSVRPLIATERQALVDRIHAPEASAMDRDKSSDR